jgi:hypothetical protein
MENLRTVRLLVDGAIAAMHSRSLHRANGTLFSDVRAGRVVPYVRVGLVRCGVCGGSSGESCREVQGARGIFSIPLLPIATARAPTACRGKLPLRDDRTRDEAVIDTVSKSTLMKPNVVERALASRRRKMFLRGQRRRRKREALVA